LTDELRVVGALCAAALLATVLVPIAIRLAVSFDFFDRPVGYKAHAAATPYLGGSAVVAAFLATAALFQTDRALLSPLAGGAALLCAVGTVDDRHGLGPGIRIVAAAGVAAALWMAGLGWSLPAGDAVELAVTVVWVVGLVNAFNLMDNMDGAAGAVSAAAAVSVAALAVRAGDAAVATVAAALCGACIGFLRYNLARPARIFLGDGGSMPIGLVVATAVMALPVGHDLGWVGLLVAGLLVGMPVLDTTLVVWSRRRRSIPVLQGARDHLTHRLRARFGTAFAVAMVLAAAQLVLGALAVVADGLEPAVLAPVFPGAVLVLVVAVLVLDSPGWAPPEYAALPTLQTTQATASERPPA
jgi:UDP-GlcNAc:undecaprenyl-phosphate/decaprenyl-phosphate GlcNAc-1-phosphate transferase